MNSQIIKINNLTKNFYQNKNSINILNNIDFDVSEGDIISISGPSGSGKSTFLNILGLLDSDFLGEYILLNKNTKNLSNKDKNLIRNLSIGFVHQFFHLIPELSIIENVSLPHLIRKNNFKESQNKAHDILVNFGLSNRMHFKPNNISGGEQQRVAIARALINDPNIIFADEMTGNLDRVTSDLVFNFFIEKLKEHNKSLIYVTHNKEYANKASKRYEISEQKLIRII